MACRRVEKEMMVTTGNISALSSISAKISGQIIDLGEGATQYGHYYSTTSNDPLSGSKTQLGIPTGKVAFTSELTALSPGTKYYIKAYISDGEQTVYGKEISFSTFSVLRPTAETSEATFVTNTTAILNGSVNPNNSSTTVIFEYGLTTAYGSTANASPSPLDGNVATGVSASLTTLTDGTLYHYRVKAENSIGISYGSDLTFTTSCTAPADTTYAATNPEPTAATLNGIVNANNAETIVKFEYGTTTSYGSEVTALQSPVTGNNNTLVSASVNGLMPFTVYHFRVKAVNCKGTNYGDDLSFKTLCPGSITVTHTVGSVAPVTKMVTYRIVQTNLTGEDKCWIVKNLGADREAISATDNTEPANGWYWQFNRAQGYKYDTARIPATTWTTVSENSNWMLTNDPCALLLGTGWRIPTSMEWTMANTNGGWGNWNDTYASVLKLHAHEDYLYWDRGEPFFLASYGYYWSSTQFLSNMAWCLYFFGTGSNVEYENKAFGFSVRCLKD